MKSKNNTLQHLGFIALAFAGLSATTAQAASQTWTNSASDLLWNTTSSNWTGAVWTNNNDAVFGATGVGSIAVASDVIVNDITFSTTGHTLTGNLKLADDQASSFTLNANETISAIIANNTAGASSLTKAGAGTLTLSGVNTYTGGTTVSAGILQLTQLTGATATGTFSLGGGTLQISQAGNNFGYASTIGLTAASTFSNIGVGAINYTGTLTGNSHALNVNSGVTRIYINSTTSGITQFNVTSGAMGFDLNAGNRGGGADVVVSSGASLWFANANTTLANNITLNGGVGLGGVGALFQEGTANATLSGILTLNSTSTIGSNGTGNATLSGKVTGAGGLIKIGSNNYILTNAANDYSGTTTITSGTLTLNGNTGVLPSNATINGGGGTFNYQGATAGSTLDASGYTLGGGLTIQSTYGTSGNTQVTLANATRTAGNTFNYATSGGTNGTTNKIVFNSAPSTGVLLDKGLFFNGSNYAVYDAGGFVRAYDYSTDPNGATSTGGTTLGSVTGNNVDLTTADVTAQTTDSINTLRLGTTFGVAMAASQTLTVDGILKSGGNAATITGGSGIQASSGSEMVIRTNASGDTLTISTPILANDASSLTKSGGGKAILLSSNTYTGGTVITAGRLAIGGSAAANSAGLGTGSVTVNSGAVLETGANVSSNTNVVTVANNITLAGGTIFANDAFQHLSGTLTVGANGGTLGSTYNGAGGDVNKGLFVDGVVSGSGALTIQRSGIQTGQTYDTSMVYFTNNSNTYSGTVTVNPSGDGGSYLGINASSALASATVNLSGNNFGSKKFGNSTLVFNTGLGTANIGALGGSADVILLGYNESTHAQGADAIALNVGGNGASTTYSGVMSGSGSLTKVGSGTMTLSGANTYTGDTTVTAGILAVNGNAIADANKLVINGGKVNPTGGTELVGTLYFGAAQQASGTWGASGSGAAHIDNTHFTGTGVVSVTTGPASGYSTWATTNVGGQTPGEDYNNDGVSNGIAYFMNNTGVITLPGIVGGAVTWTNGGNIPTSAYGTQYRVQTSPNLVTWTPVEAVDLTTNSNGPGGLLTYTLPTGQGKFFVRLAVTPQ